MDVNFIRFEIEQRKYSPNAIVGIYKHNGDEKRKYIVAPATSLGKKLGDHMVNRIKEVLDNEFCDPFIA